MHPSYPLIIAELAGIAQGLEPRITGSIKEVCPEFSIRESPFLPKACQSA
jgi:hypothetical protein